ncbi:MULTISPECIES: hypothetical protein [unclassified Bartonella]
MLQKLISEKLLFKKGKDVLLLATEEPVQICLDIAVELQKT